MRFSLSLLFLLLISFNSFSQKGNIEGEITDTKSGNKITGATITVDNSKIFVISNVDGRFVVKLDAGKKYNITISSVGYKSKNITDIDVLAGQVTNLEIMLEATTKTETGVVVKSSARKETAAALIAYQKNTNVVSQVISAEAIRRSPDKNTAEVLKRIPGMSMMEGKYLVVRGLADRYNQAMLNGVLLGSTEPDRKTFSFDIFPSQLVENIIVNKSFIPELPGEWAGGLIQVNTKDVPGKSFLTVQIGTGFNTQTVGKDFYGYKGGKTDFLGFDDGTRALPDNFPTKSTFSIMSHQGKIDWAKKFENTWTPYQKNNSNNVLNKSLQINGGFNKNIGRNKKLGAIFALNYNNSVKRTDVHNAFSSFYEGSNTSSLLFDYNSEKYNNDVLWGALGNLTLQIGNNHKISFKNLVNVNTLNYTTLRSGVDFENAGLNGDNIKATELAFKANTFFNTQISGDHNLSRYHAKFHWYGSFSILDQYIPDQRRIQYNQDRDNPSAPYMFLVSSSATSQKSGSRYYGFLNDYVYTAGADLNRSFVLGERTQNIKAGYLFQVKDRLFDSRPFAIYLPVDNPSLRLLPADKIFSAENFGDGFNNYFSFSELSGSSYRYMANNILNAAFLQLDNQLSEKIRAVWGVRWENYDQLIGSVKKTDPRHVHSEINDFLPGLNLTYKIKNNTNIRLSASQTVVRPEIRELSTFQFYDFDLGATVAGNPNLRRTKVTNADLRYELYPRPGELFTAGVFYKHFRDPIEAYFNAGSGSSSSFNYINADIADAYGAEVEFRKKLDFLRSLRNFTFQTNVSYIYNRVKDFTSSDVNRPMQGQSPYLLNAALQYDVEKYGLSTTILYNQIGDRILYVGGSGLPPIVEQTRPLLDLQIAKKILRSKGELKLNISDLLNKEAFFYYDRQQDLKYNGADLVAIRRRYGSTIGFSFSYSLK